MTTNNALTESFDNGVGALGNAWNVSVANGAVTLNGSSALMEWATGASAGHGYGTYTVTAKVDGSQPGPGIILWPGDNQWPGQEIDMLEITPDGSGRQYGTVHWNNNGSDAYATVIYDGVQGGTYHDYTMVWAPGEITFKVDGVTKGSIDGNVPVDFDHGGMNNTIGVMNNNANTSITVSHIEFTPLGGTVQAPVVAAPAVTVETPVATVAVSAGISVTVDWNALAAQVEANFAATGRWELPGDQQAAAAPAPAPAPAAHVDTGVVDWDALAAQVTANFNATGHWYI